VATLAAKHDGDGFAGEAGGLPEGVVVGGRRRPSHVEPPGQGARGGGAAVGAAGRDDKRGDSLSRAWGPRLEKQGGVEKMKKRMQCNADKR